MRGVCFGVKCALALVAPPLPTPKNTPSTHTHAHTNAANDSQPRLGRPAWLHAWAARTPAAPAPDAEARDVLVVAYGLVRSLPTLARTLASLRQHGPRNARLAVVAQCAPLECAGAGALLRRLEPDALALVDARPVAALGPRDVCVAAAAAAAANASASAEHALDAPRHAAYFAAHRALEALVDWRADGIVLWRLDTELRTPVDVRALAPWAHCPDCVHVPCEQHGGYLNDRFAHGGADAMRRFQLARVALLRTRCDYGERCTLAAARAARVRIAFTRTRVVRVRADGSVPDVDRAAVFGTIPARSWMTRINALSDALRCNATPVGQPSPQCAL